MSVAMILAAGEGRRMRPLTNTTPKPLIHVRGKALLAYHLEALVAAGFEDIVVNASYLSEQIVDFCGDGERWGCRLTLSIEPEPLETAGGIVQALQHLGDEPFVVVNADIHTDFPFERLQQVDLADDLAYLVMTPNPPHHASGDFHLLEDRIDQAQGPRFTFSGLSVMSPKLFSDLMPGKAPLRPILDSAIQRARVSGELWEGVWSDVGTPERLEHLETLLDRGV